MENSQPKHLSPWIAWSLVVLAFGLALFCVWYYYFQVGVAYDNSVTHFIGIKTKTPAATSTTATTSATADWNTYTSTTYGFTIKYPKTWVYQNEGNNRVGFALSKNLLHCNECDETSTITLLINDSYNPKTDTTVNSTTDTTVDGIATKVYVVTNPSDAKFANMKSKFCMFTKGSNNYDLLLQDEGLNSDTNQPVTGLIASYGNIFDQMLSTFQFTK